MGARVRSMLRMPREDGEIRRFTALGARVRLTVGLVALVVIPLSPGLASHERTTLAAVIAFAYLPYAAVVGWATRDNPSPIVQVPSLLGDLAIIFLVSVAAPESRVVALFGYALLVTFHTFLGGFVVGALVAGGALILASAAEESDPTVMVSGYTLVMFAAALVVLAAIVESATRERRRAARFLTRLQEAIRDVPATPDLTQTLDHVAAGARRAVEAKFVSVLVQEPGGITQGALEGDHHPDPPERSKEIIARILEQPGASPSGIALTTGKRVVVPVIADDPRFVRWIPETERQGFTSTVAVPLRTGSSVIGVLAAYFPSPELVTPENVDLLAAYADHVTLVILRALAYEHEKDAARRVAEADAMKTDLVATVSHELRTPLTSIKGFVETVLRYWERLEDEERRRLLDRVRTNADHLSLLIDRVLDYSRLEAGQVETILMPFDAASEVRRVLGDMAPVVGEHEVVVDAEPDVVVQADPNGFHAVVQNLVGNAAKYAPPGTTISIAVRLVGDEIVTSVTDQGPGIDPADHVRIFDRFYRAGGVSGSRGSGLGLSIVARYCDLMGGRVWLDSAPGEGSTFSFALPAAVGMEVSPSAAR